jgi:hypothetical protein
VSRTRSALLLVGATIAFGASPLNAVPARATSGSTTGPAQVKIIGASPQQQVVLEKIVGGIPQNRLRRVEVRSAPPDWKPFPAGSVELSLTARAPRSVWSLWQEDLVAGAFHDLSLAMQLPFVVAYSTANASSRLAGTDPHPPDVAPNEVRALKFRLRREVARGGAKTQAINVVHPYGFALSVTVRTRRPAHYLKYQLRTLLGVLPRGSRLDGTLFAIQDPSGAPVYTLGSSSRAGSSTSWIRRDLAGCDPFWRSPGPSHRPPCPAR